MFACSLCTPTCFLWSKHVHAALMGGSQRRLVTRLGFYPAVSTLPALIPDEPYQPVLLPLNSCLLLILNVSFGATGSSLILDVVLCWEGIKRKKKKKWTWNSEEQPWRQGKSRTAEHQRQIYSQIWAFPAPPLLGIPSCRQNLQWEWPWNTPVV